MALSREFPFIAEGVAVAVAVLVSLEITAMLDKLVISPEFDGRGVVVVVVVVAASRVAPSVVRETTVVEGEASCLRPSPNLPAATAFRHNTKHSRAQIRGHLGSILVLGTTQS